MYGGCFTLVNLDFPIYKRRNRAFSFLGTPTVVKTNILIRSMGPVSELDMVSLTCQNKRSKFFGEAQSSLEKTAPLAVARRLHLRLKTRHFSVMEFVGRLTDGSKL